MASARSIEESIPMPTASPSANGNSTSRSLLARAQRGDTHALGRLFLRCLPDLHRWAHAQLRRVRRRGDLDSQDVVQDAFLRTIRRFDDLDLHSRQALAAYLRQAVLNRIRDEHRRVSRRSPLEAVSTSATDQSPTPFDQALTAEDNARYLAGLNRLSETDRELIVAHVELDYTHEQLGRMTGRSANAARMALQRAIQRLMTTIRDG